MKKFLFSGVIVALFALGFAASDEPDNETPDETPSQSQTDIPSDDKATPNPDLGGEPNTTMPNIQYSVISEDKDWVFRIDMTGVQDPNTLEWMELLGTLESKQNIWLEIDGEPKGVKVYNISDSEGHTVPVDLVFLVDNSGSMSEEADAVARDIIAWSQKLASSGLDIRFGCVGFDGYITGAIDFTTPELLSEWLNEGKGTDRTCGFGGPNADKLVTEAPAYKAGPHNEECGMAALRFADENFNFKKGANRIYVNFTDEPNQPNGKKRFSVESLLTDWDTNQGTIHTVFSDRETYDRNERNKLMSDYTGGTTIYTNSSFTGMSLDVLPVTAAMQHSYIIRISNILKYLDGEPHEVHITIKAPDGSVRVERWFTVTFEK